MGATAFTQLFIQAHIKETSKLRVTGLCVGDSSVTDEIPAQVASNAENVSIWWRHHDVVVAGVDNVTILMHCYLAVSSSPSMPQNNYV